MSLILLYAIMIDGIVGDPKWLYNRIPHPVTWMAGLLMAGESILNIGRKSNQTRRILGLVWIIICIVFCYVSAFIIQEYVEKWDDTGFILALLASVFLAYRSLMDHLGAVEKALLKNNIDEARREVSKIVGRDTRTLDKNAIARASIESVAENFSDGVVAPVFWFLVAGLPGIVTYKMINTADSMIGNRSKRFEHFGWASAKIDDVANYLPARLSFLIIICAGWISATGNIKSGILTAYNFHHKHASPNAGWPEATMAGILNVRLGGPRFYQNGNRKDNAWLGIGRDVEIMDLIIALTLINFSWIIILIALIIGAMI